MRRNEMKLEAKGFQPLSDQEAMNLDGGVGPLIAIPIGMGIKAGKIYLGGIAFGAGAKMTYNAFFKK